MKGTTVIAVKRDGKIAIACDGQVTMGNNVVKAEAKKIRRLYNDKVLAGFAGSTADAFTLFSRLENKLNEFSGNLTRASVELAKDWRTDRVLRRLEAVMIAADKDNMYLISGAGDVITPDDDLCGIGSGGSYALAAARALVKYTDLDAKSIAEEAVNIASSICIYTNKNIVVDMLEDE
ncbi:MAG: ATP-dependent protease subunit HslV [Deltaproteobacteria bacterium]|nr:ATP-dependent protease subunit HslV [Deltaproteobacteria bacterium]